MRIATSTRQPITQEFELGPVAECRLETYPLDHATPGQPPRTIVYVALGGEAQVTADVLAAWASWLLDRAAELRAAEHATRV